MKLIFAHDTHSVARIEAQAEAKPLIFIHICQENSRKSINYPHPFRVVFARRSRSNQPSHSKNPVQTKFENTSGYIILFFMNPATTLNKFFFLG